MAVSQVDIANRALDEIGKSALSTMADTTSNGDLVRRHFDTVAGTIVMKPTWWEFDTTLKMNPAVDADYDGTTNTHRYRYSLPNRLCIRGLMDVNFYSITDYKIEGDFLYCDDSVIYLVYVTGVPTAYPHHIANAIVPKLAAAMSKKGEGNRSKSSLLQEYKMNLAEAKVISQRQRPPRMWAVDNPYTFIEVRNGAFDADNFPPNTFGP